MNADITLQEAHYIVMSECKNYAMTMIINFVRGDFTLQTNRGKCDFVFLDADPGRAVEILGMMRSAAEVARKLIQRHSEEGVVYGIQE